MAKSMVMSREFLMPQADSDLLFLPMLLSVVSVMLPSSGSVVSMV